jgi:signal transduction histidine kinase
MPPVAEMTVASPPFSPLSPSSAEPARPKILIIDDDYGPRESLRILLKYDYDVQVASSVADGVAIVTAQPIDTIILDNRMPGRTGLEGIADIRQTDENVSIIMLTGYGTLETACEAFRKQATDFMTKPPDTEALLEAVAKNVTLSRAKRARSNLSKELAEMNMNLSAELSETRPLAKLGQRSDEIIHDLGNPLTILTCCIELLQTKINEMRPEAGGQWIEALGYIQMIKRSVQHCCSLADTWRQLRDDISQDRNGVSAQEFLVEAVDSLQPMANMAKVVLRLEAENLSADANIEIDATQMRRVAHNLMINALQSTEAGRGLVSVRARTVEQEFEFSVTDNGSGIPADRLAVIFEPYFSTKSEGTGLGLAIAKRIVEEHSGNLRAESELGRGSTFVVRLPLKQKG